MSTKQRHRHTSGRHAAVSAREVLLVLLIAVLGGIGIYVSTDTNTAFGLLTQPVYADFVPVQITFRSGALLSQPFLELNVVNRNKPTTQVAGDDFDTANPPAVTGLVALNTRIGGEVMVYWTFPAHVTNANVYRSDTTTNTETQIATALSANYYQDEHLENGTIYTYRVVSTVLNGTGDGTDGVESQSIAPTAVVTPNDTIAPEPPTEVTVIQIDAAGGEGLHIAWTNPLQPDLDHIVVYRSAQFGSRGEQVASIAATDPAVYADATAPTNTSVYYTVVAYDAAGNASADDFQTPLPGNDSPFTPFGVSQ